MESPVLVSDIRPGVNSSDPRDMTWVGNKVFFTAGVDGSADQNRELWVTDGTETGTEMVRDIYLGESASNPGWLTRLFVRLDANPGQKCISLQVMAFTVMSCG